MSKQSNKEKRESEELDLILAQIQQTFGNEDNEDADDNDSLESNDNAEFSEMLKQLIRNAESTSSITSASNDSEDEEFSYKDFIDEDIEDERVSDNNEPASDKSESEDITVTDAELVAEDDLNVTAELDEDSAIAVETPSETEVDGVLQLMFSHTPQHVSEAADVTSTDSEAVRVEEIIEEIVEEITSEPISDSYSDEGESIIEGDILSSSTKNAATSILDVPLSYFDDDDEESEKMIEGEYDQLNYEPIPEEIDEYAANEVDQNHIGVSVPRIILTQDEYTYDPLQNRLPEFAPDFVMIDCDDEDAKDTDGNPNTSQEPNRDDNDHLDTNDISLLLSFGYGEEIKSRVSEDESHKIFNEKYSSFSPESHKVPYGFCGKEITDKKNSKQIREKFKTDKSIIIIQLTLMSIMMITTLLLEGFFEFFSDRSSYIAISAIEMVFVAITVITLNKKLLSGLLGIIRFEANLYSIAAYLLFAYSICNIATSLIYIIEDTSAGTSTLMLFGFCITLYIVFILIAELLNCTREEENFKMMSRSAVIRTAEAYTAPKDRKRSSKVISKGDTRSCKLVKTSIISGFFQKSSNSVFCDVNLIYVIGIVPILSLVAGAISTVISESILNGVYTMMTTTLLCIPFAYVLDPSVIEYVTALSLKNDKIALIGYSAANELSKTNAICFDDTDAIEIISFTEIHPTKSTDGQKNLDLAHRVFKALGGPLGEHSHKTGGTALTADDRSEVIINSISENGLAIYFDSSINILFGDKNYMQAHNINVKTDSNLSTAIKGFDRSVVYMAFDGIPKLGFIITSKVKPEFINILSLLVKHNIEIFVDTYEPQINDLYFEQNKTEGTSSVSVAKSEKYEYSDFKPICDGQIICTSDSFSLAKAIVQCKEIVQRRKRHRRTIYVIIALGFAVSCLLMLLMNVGEASTFLGTLKTHAGIVLNLAMLTALIPGTVSVIRMIKKKNITKKTKETK